MVLMVLMALMGRPEPRGLQVRPEQVALMARMVRTGRPARQVPRALLAQLVRLGRTGAMARTARPGLKVSTPSTSTALLPLGPRPQRPRAAPLM